MNIIVCIKQVIHIYIQSGVDRKTKALYPEGYVFIVNPYDEVAVEEAVRIKEKLGEGEVTLITLGPFRAEKALRWCLAMGADKAIHILEEDIGDLDSWATSLALSKVIGDLDYDLIFFGKQAIDDAMGQVGAFVAELLNLPMVSAVTKVEFSPRGKKTTVQRALERGNREVIECPLPAVFAVEKSLNTPRYPTVPGRKTALTKMIQRMDLDSLRPFGDKRLESPMIKVIRLAPPKLRPKKILAPSSDMSAADRMDWILSGGISKKEGGMLSGDLGQLASGIVEFLRERKII